MFMLKISWKYKMNCYNSFVTYLRENAPQLEKSAIM